MSIFFCADQLKLFKNEEAIKTFSCFHKKQIISTCRYETKQKTVFFIITRKIIYKVSSKDHNIEIFFDVNIERSFYKPWDEMCALVYQKQLCLIGGSKETKPQRTFQVTQIKEPKWVASEPLNSSRVRPVGCVSGNCIFVAGGWALSYINSIERFNGQFWVTLDFRISEMKNLALVPVSSARFLVFGNLEDKGSVTQINLNRKSVEFMKEIENTEDIKNYNICLDGTQIKYFSHQKIHQIHIIENRWPERETFLLIRERLSFRLV